ncbi:MAG: hypothetical protein AB1847_15435 [bacterium]
MAASTRTKPIPDDPEYTDLQQAMDAALEMWNRTERPLGLWDIKENVKNRIIFSL